MIDLSTDDGIRTGLRAIAAWADQEGAPASGPDRLLSLHPGSLRRRWLARPLTAAAAVMVVVLIAVALTSSSDPAEVPAASGSWSMMAESPLSPRYGAVGLWTGSEMLVLGGSSEERTLDPGPLKDGARYDPATDTWRRMAPLPGADDGRRVRFGAWDGREAVYLLDWAVAAGMHDYDLVAYDPAADTWRTILEARFPDRMVLGAGVGAVAPVPIENPWALESVAGRLVMFGLQISTQQLAWTTLDAPTGTWDDPHEFPPDQDLYFQDRTLSQVVGRRVFVAFRDASPLNEYEPPESGSGPPVLSPQVAEYGVFIDPVTGGTESVTVPRLQPSDESTPSLFDLQIGQSGDELTLVGVVTDGHGQSQRRSWRLDGTTDAWAEAEPPSDSPAHGDMSQVALVSTDRGIVLLGGIADDGDGSASGGLRSRGPLRHAASPDLRRWAPLPQAPIDLGRAGAVAVWTGTEILLWGGTSDTRAIGIQYGGVRGSLLADGARFRIGGADRRSG